MLSLVTSCVPSYDDIFGHKKTVCYSACGQSLHMDSPDVETCSEFERREYIALYNFQKYVNLPGWNNCQRLCKHVNGNSVTVVTTDAGVFYDWPDNNLVYGYDLGQSIYFSLPSNPEEKDWMESALVHEWGHQLEWSLNHIIDSDHKDWNNNGIYQAINASVNMYSTNSCW